ncbi:hypothetical protein [Corallococcus caeni]
MSPKDEWVVLWDRAKELGPLIAEKKRTARAAIAARFPEVGKQQFGNLVRAADAGKLRPEIAALVRDYQIEIVALEQEERAYRQKSDQLLEEHRQADKRTRLDPRVDVIPSGPYPKLRQCRTYPLRQDCNYGENETARWERCEFMKYDESQSSFSSARWQCTALDK